MSHALAFEDRGSGSPLVLLHGFPLDRRMWDGQLNEFASKHRVITPDLLGFGLSKSDESLTIEALADDVHTLLAGLNALPCVLGGLSMGGYVALAYARKYASDLRGLILLDTKAEGDTPEQKQGRHKMIDLVRSKGAKAVAEEMLPKLVAPDLPNKRPAVAQALRNMMEGCRPLTIEHALLAMHHRPDQTPYLASITFPTLILVGDADAITPVSVAQAMRKQIPGSVLSIVKGSGHMSPMEQPGQVNQAIGRFLQRFDSMSEKH